MPSVSTVVPPVFGMWRKRSDATWANGSSFLGAGGPLDGVAVCCVGFFCVAFVACFVPFDASSPSSTAARATTQATARVAIAMLP